MTDRICEGCAKGTMTKESCFRVKENLCIVRYVCPQCEAKEIVKYTEAKDCHNCDLNLAKG
jgi:hypothetical protein